MNNERELIFKLTGKADEVFSTIDNLTRAGLTLQQAADAIKMVFVAGRIEAGRPLR
jgi:hypothetical protein